MNENDKSRSGLQTAVDFAHAARAVKRIMQAAKKRRDICTLQPLLVGFFELILHVGQLLPQRNGLFPKCVDSPHGNAYKQR